MPKAPSTDAALRVVLNVRETEQMKALKEENVKFEKKLETAEKVQLYTAKGFQTQAQNCVELIIDMEAAELISAPVAEVLRQHMTNCFRL